jgi:hypothetical protein
MKYAVKMGSGAMMHIPRFVKIGFGHSEVDRWDTQIHKQHGDHKIWKVGAGHVARMGMHIGYWWESQKERVHWEDQDVGGWTILKWILGR